MDKKKTVCVSTCCGQNSYGAVLQSMGLQKTLNEMGFDSYVLRANDMPPAEKRERLVFSKKPKRMLYNLARFVFQRKINLRYRKCVDFIHKNVDVRYYGSYEKILENPPQADYYISGSDQVWHPDVCDKTYFLDFLKDDKKRLSYAASMGALKVSNETEFARLVSKMDSISVREADMVDIIKKYTDKEISVNIDPTFLRPMEEWKSMESPYDIKKPYVLVFPIYWDKKFNSELKELHKKTGYEIVLLTEVYSPAWHTRKITDANPGQFLWLIDNAEAVITSSFHGVALSLLLNKKISAVINPEKPSRLTNILKLLQVETPKIADVMSFDLSVYDQTNKRIDLERKRSIDYLKKILEME